MIHTNTVISALKVAAEQYDKDAQNIFVNSDPNESAALNHLQLQFRRQAQECRELAATIEETDGDTVLP